MSDEKTLGEIYGSWLIAAKELFKESRAATIKEAVQAMKDANYDKEQARQLLKERGQWETPETRKAKIVERIADREEYKRGLRNAIEATIEQWIARADREIARLKEELNNLG